LFILDGLVVVVVVVVVVIEKVDGLDVAG